MCASSKLEEWESCPEVSGRWLKASDAKFSFLSSSLGRCSSGSGPLLLSVKLMTRISAATAATNTIITFWSVPTAAPGASIMGNLSVLLPLLKSVLLPLPEPSSLQYYYHCSYHWRRCQTLEAGSHFTSPPPPPVCFSVSFSHRKWHGNNMPISLTVQMQNSPENISNLSQSVC